MTPRRATKGCRVTPTGSNFTRLRRWSWTVVRIGLLPLLILGSVYWLRFAPVLVQEASVGRGAIVSEVMGTGTLEARVSTTISPKIAGRISSVTIDQGERVKAGDLLVQLDAEELEQQVEIARAQVDVSKAAVIRLEADKARATASLEQAQRTLVRVEKLAASSSVSREELERSSEALAVAIAETARAEAAITEGQKSLLAAEKTLEYHLARLRDTRIVAPFDGLIVARHREAGDVVVPGSGVLTLISTDLLWVTAWVDETAMSSLAAGQVARVVFRSEVENAYAGEVIRLAKESDRETREFIVDVKTLELPGNWAIGQRADVYIETGRKDDVTQIEPDLLHTIEGARGVFVNENGYAQWRPLTLGMHSPAAIEVVGGLVEGERVIKPKFAETKLRDGRRVSVGG